MPKLEDVFGIAKEPLKSYHEREHVDRLFVKALKDDRHIVVYGSSKQGKSSLRQKHLDESKCTIYRCSPVSTPLLIYQRMLSSLNVRQEISQTTKTGGKVGGRTIFSFLALLPFFGGGSASGEVSGEKSSEMAVQSQSIVQDIEDAQSVCDLLKKARYDKRVVLENFHYLPTAVQIRLAFDLKTFQEEGIQFLVFGIWKEANFLVVHNGDLRDRVTEIPVEPWESTDFDEVINKGEKALKISIPIDIRDQLKANAYGNVGMLQEFLRQYCELHHIEKTQSKTVELDRREILELLFDKKMQEYRTPLLNVLRIIAAQSSRDGDRPLVLPYYLILVVLGASISELQAGIHRNALLLRIKAIHHRVDKDSILMSDLVSCLLALPMLQQEMQPLLHYDSSQQLLKLVDTQQFFVLSRINSEAAQSEIPHPLAPLER